MGSMDKIKNETTELRSYIKKFTHAKCISEKLDGISLLLDFTSKTVKAFTRGDGSYGQSVTQILPYVKNLKKAIREFVNNNDTYCGYIRGELIIKKKNWLRIQHKGKNARNFVAGILHKKTVDPNDFEYVEFVAYQFIAHPIKKEIITPSIQLTFLEKAGFTVVKHNVFAHSLLEKKEWLLNQLLEWKEMSEYEIDGLIITDNHPHNLTLSGNPEYSKAFKFNSIEDSIITTVKSVEWNISKDGKMKPTVLLEPIDIEGVTIQRVTGFNARFIQDSGIGKGAQVRIIRSGGVIPKIVGVYQKTEPELPDLKKDGLKWDSNGVDIVLSDNFSIGSVNEDNNDDDEKKTASVGLTISEKMDVKRIEYFIQTMGIEFYKSKTIEKGYIQANIKNIYDLLTATEKTFEKIDGIKDKSSSKIVSSIKKQIMTQPIYVFAAGLSIFPNMGVKKLELLFDKSNVIENLVNLHTQDARTYRNVRYQITSIRGFSDNAAQIVIENFPMFMEVWSFIKSNFRESNIAIYPEKIEVLEEIDEKEEESIYPEFNRHEPLIADTVIVFSGFRDEALEKQIKKYGGTVADNLLKSQKCCLLVKDKSKNSSKMIKAQSMEFPIMTVEEFIQEVKI
jgi:NAD-dependent DNA ligase